MTSVGDDSRGNPLGRPWLIVGSILAVAATVALVFGDDARWLRLGIVAALWAALVGGFVAVRYRKQAASTEQTVAQAQEVYELELEREIAARREYELEVEAETRQRVEDSSRDEIAALREEVAALRESLQALLGGEVLYERVALTAQSTRMRSLNEEQRVVRPAHNDGQSERPRLAGTQAAGAEAHAGRTAGTNGAPGSPAPTWGSVKPAVVNQGAGKPAATAGKRDAVERPTDLIAKVADLGVTENVDGGNGSDHSDSLTDVRSTLNGATSAKGDDEPGPPTTHIPTTTANGNVAQAAGAGRAEALRRAQQPGAVEPQRTYQRRQPVRPQRPSTIGDAVRSPGSAKGTGAFQEQPAAARASAWDSNDKSGHGVEISEPSSGQEPVQRASSVADSEQSASGYWSKQSEESRPAEQAVRQESEKDTGFSRDWTPSWEAARIGGHHRSTEQDSTQDDGGQQADTNSTLPESAQEIQRQYRPGGRRRRLDQDDEPSQDDASGTTQAGEDVPEVSVPAGGRRRRADGAPTWQDIVVRNNGSADGAEEGPATESVETEPSDAEPDYAHQRNDEIVTGTSGEHGVTEQADESEESRSAGGSHEQGRSVSDLLAAHGTGGSTRHRRRRAQE